MGVCICSLLLYFHFLDLPLWILTLIVLIYILFKPFFTYIAVPPLLHSVAVNSNLYPGIITELRGALFSLNLVSLTPKRSNANLHSEIRVESSSMWKGSEEILKWNKDSFLDYSLKMKARRVYNTWWKLLQMKRHP